MLRTLLTTVDNPHSPFENWDAWYEYDTRLGYDSCGLLARIAIVSTELSDVDYELATASAIDEIVRLNVSGVHRKVTKEIED